MSRFVQTQFVKHPVFGVVLVGLRWLSWTVLAHPAGSLAAVLVVGVGGRFDFGIAVAVAAMLWVTVEGLLFGCGPVWYRSWSLGCRFARCWPSLWASIVKDAGKVSASDSGFGVARLVCSCPWISMVPRVSGSSVSWKVRAQKGFTLKVLEDATNSIAASDRRIHDVEVSYGRATETKAVMSVSFGDVLEDVEAPVWV